LKDGLENIDEVFKQAFDGFEANVDPNVWTNIQSGLNAGGTTGTPQVDPVSSAVTSSVAKSVIIKIAAAVVAVGTIATASYYIVTAGSENEKTVAENAIIEEPIIEETLVDNTIEEATEDNQVTEIENDEVKEQSEQSEEVIEPVKEQSSTPKVEDEMPEKNSDIGNNQESSNQSNDSQNSSPETQSKKANSNKDAQQMPTEKKADVPKETKPIENDQPAVKDVTPEKKEAVVDDIPKAFSPNGDGIGDVIKIEGENLEKMEIVIMDKMGKVVYKMTNIEQQWDGKDMNGFDLIQGTYYMAGVVVDSDGNTKNIKQAINLFK